MLEPCDAHTLPHIDTHPRRAAPAAIGLSRYILSEGLYSVIRSSEGTCAAPARGPARLGRSARGNA